MMRTKATAVCRYDLLPINRQHQSNAACLSGERNVRLLKLICMLVCTIFLNSVAYIYMNRSIQVTVALVYSFVSFLHLFFLTWPMQFSYIPGLVFVTFS